MIKIGEKKGDFQIKAEIGKGGMGTIYYAVDTMLNREIALKVIHPQLANNEQLMERFKIEAMTQARMNHPNIVTIFSFSKIDNDNVIAMEYVEGKNLKDLLREKRVLSVEEALGYLKQILSALEYSHSRNVIHRDIKPANILITEDNRVKLSDFGIAKVFGKQGLTKTGMLLGTPWYTPPEQILGENIDFRSDLYSVGITFFEMVTGTVPFDSETNSDFQIQKAHLETPPPRPSIYNPEIGSRIEKFILKALQKKPEKRFQSATEMLKFVESLEKKVSETTAIRKGKTTVLELDKEAASNNKKTKKRVFFTLISLILLIGIAAIYYFVLKPTDKSVLTPDPQKSESQAILIDNPPVKSENADNSIKTDINNDEKISKPEGKEENPLSKEINTQAVKKNRTSDISNKEKKDQNIKKVISKKPAKKSLRSEIKNTDKPVENNSELKSDYKEQKDPVSVNTSNNINIDAELINLRRILENGNLKNAEKKTDELLKNGITSAKLYSFAGKLNFFKRNFKKAEQYWEKAIDSNGSINLRFFHKHGIFNKGCSGQLIIKKNLIIFDSITKPSHSIALTVDKIKKVEKPKNSFGIRILFLSKKSIKKNIFILKGRNRKGEKFLTEFINKYILEDK